MLVAVDREKCEYQFEWPTAVVCASSLVTPDTGCNYVDKEANVTFNLSILTSDGKDVQVCCDMFVVFEKQLCISFWILFNDNYLFFWHRHLVIQSRGAVVCFY